MEIVNLKLEGFSWRQQPKETVGREGWPGPLYNTSHLINVTIAKQLLSLSLCKLIDQTRI